MSNVQDHSLFKCLPDLKKICNISEQRGKELLEATNGSLERAVDLHLFHSTSTHDIPKSCKSKDDSDKSKKRLSTNIPSTESPRKRLKEGSLHSFFSTGRNTSLPREDVPPSFSAGGKFISIDRNKKSASMPPTKKNESREEIHQNLDSLEIMSFEHLAKTLQTISDTRKRSVKLEALKGFILDYAKDCGATRAAYSLTCAISIILGNTTEERLGVSGRTVSSALQNSLGISSRQLSEGYRQHGDLGDSAATFFQSKRYFVSLNDSRSLSVVELYQALQKVIDAAGNNEKKAMVSRLIHCCQTRNELRFLVRFLIGNMRIGCNIKTVLAAVALAFQSHSSDTQLSEKSAIQLVQKTHDLCPDIEKILQALLLGGFEKLENDCNIQLFTPISPMLANPAHSLAEIDQAMAKTQNSVVLEWKYDGVRCQAHFCHGHVKLFSRHMLETTEQYPDAVRGILDARKQSKRIDSFIIDAEIVGVEGQAEKTRLLPFQDLASRKKKDDGTGVKVKVFCFDLMYLNGKSFVTVPLWKRRDLLREHFSETTDFAFVSSKLMKKFDERVIHNFLTESMRQGTEGLMVKMIGKRLLDQDASGDDGFREGGTYEAGTRSHSWLKVKRDYVEGFADTIDVVPIGAWHGTGRKAEKNFLSPVLLAVYDEDEDVYRSICRCMTFTDAMYTAIREFYLQGVAYPAELPSVAHETEKILSQKTENEKRCLQEAPTVNQDEELLDLESSNCFANRPTSAFIVTNEQPPIWFRPLEVWEISYADMSLSRQHTAGAGIVPDPDGRGIALRFPRFKRRRPDRRPDQATTSAQVAAMFLNQAKQMKSFTW